jgi:hypothetical protein
MSKVIFLSIPLVLALTSCGTTTSERALSGAGIGAATGAAGAALFDGNIGTGAAIGAGVGAAAGALTDQDDIDLNDVGRRDDDERYSNRDPRYYRDRDGRDYRDSDARW